MSASEEIDILMTNKYISGIGSPRNISASTQTEAVVRKRYPIDLHSPVIPSIADHSSPHHSTSSSNSKY